MENYLPDEVIDDLAEQKQLVEAYLRMEPYQKDYFDMENGFADINFDSLDDKAQSLYATLSEGDIKTFRKSGFKELFGKEEGSFKREFPKLFNSEKVTKLSLMAKTSHQSDSNELKTLVRKVRELL